MYDFVTWFLLMGAVASGDGTLPFWATANRNGLMPENSGALVYAGAKTSFDESKTLQWRWGTSAAVSFDSAAQSSAMRPMVDELYVNLRWKVLRADFGMQHRDREFLGSAPMLGSLSSTEGHIVESNNTRAMPGYKLVLEPLSIPFTKDHLKIFGTWGDFKTLDDRYVDGALVHRTMAYLRYDISSHWFFQLGLDHYAIWGGVSPMYGKMEISADNYFRVVTGRSASSSGTISDQINVIGDQGGAEQLRAGWKGNDYSVTFQYEKPYSDKSGMRFTNMPDGVYTLHFSYAEKDRWVSDILTEFKYTMWQSGTAHDPDAPVNGNNKIYGGFYLGCDNYFTNGEYKSGWTHFSRPICDPQFYTEEFDESLRKICNTRFQAIHLGVSGKLFRIAPYKLMLTGSLNYGSYSNPYIAPSTVRSDWKWWKKNTVDKPLKQFCGALIVALPLSAVSNSSLPLNFTSGLYFDRGSAIGNAFAGELGVAISF